MHVKQLLPQLHIQPTAEKKDSVTGHPVSSSQFFQERKLPAPTRSCLESLFECDLSDIRIYEGALKMPVPCRAVTFGDSIYIQKGHFDPTRSRGLELLAHEITHVLQQRAGRLPVQENGASNFIVDPVLEAEAALIGRLASAAEGERVCSRHDILPDHLMVDRGSPTRAFQPEVYIDGDEETYEDLLEEINEHKDFQTKRWRKYNKSLGNIIEEPLNEGQKQKAREKLKLWCGKGVIKSRRRSYRNVEELITDLVHQVFVDEGGTLPMEQKLADLIRNHNERISLLLTEAVRRVHENFHSEIKKDAKLYQEFLKKERHYVWYYTSLSKRARQVIGMAGRKVGDFFHRQDNVLPRFQRGGAQNDDQFRQAFESDQLRSVDAAFEYFKASRQPSWRIVAFLSDYSKMAKEIYPQYFSSINPNWWESEAKWYTEVTLQKDLPKLKAKALAAAENSYSPEEVYKERLDSLIEDYRDQFHQQLEAGFKKTGPSNLFHAFNDQYDHLFYRLPQYDARADKQGKDHPWAKKGIEHQVPLGYGPSATTTFLISLLQIVYPHEETILASALAIFEFWQNHYIQIKTNVHTWHEVMIAAAPYVYNFDFQAWKKVDRPRNLKDPNAWSFEYPNPQTLKAWLIEKEKKQIAIQPKLVPAQERRPLPQDLKSTAPPLVQLKEGKENSKSILCVTWNLELQCPDDQTLKESFVAYVKETKKPPPSLIVIGLQEAASYKARGEGIFIGNRLVASDQLLGSDYQLIATGRFKGITKFGQGLWAEHAQQVIQVLARKNEKAAAYTGEHPKGWESEKGFCFARVTLAGRDLGFVSTHLDSGTDPAKKQREGAEILKFLKEQAQGGKTFDALFIMGDLNFRVAKGGYTDDPQQWCGKIAEPLVRDNLKCWDSFTPDVFKNLPFKWPDFAPGSLPTYKRKKDAKYYQIIRSLKNDLNNESLKTLFEVKSDRPGVWDFGWLDRIGYAVMAPGQYNPVQGCGRSLLKSRLKITNPGVNLHNWHYVPFGDHSPVHCEFVLSGF